jgi:hypothetical protein
MARHVMTGQQAAATGDATLHGAKETNQERT